MEKTEFFLNAPAQIIIGSGRLQSALLREREEAENEEYHIERVKSGIPGFDDLVGGGIPSKNVVVLSGDPGSGKTSFSFGFLFEGIRKYNEAGVYVSLEEPLDDVLASAREFGYDFQEMIGKKKLKVIVVELYDFEKLKNAIEDAVQSIKAKRIVIDPGVIFKLFFEKELDARKSILALGKMLKKLGVTSIITNEINLDGTRSLFGLEEYVADGVVLLYHTKMENKFVRSIAVLKMRGTRISEKLHPLQITGKGIRVLSKQELFEEI